MFRLIPLYSFDEKGEILTSKPNYSPNWLLIEELLKKSPLAKNYQSTFFSSVVTRRQYLNQIAYVSKYFF